MTDISKTRVLNFEEVSDMQIDDFLYLIRTSGQWGDKRISYEDLKTVLLNGDYSYEGLKTFIDNVTFNGDVTGDNAPTAINHLTRKDYVDRHAPVKSIMELLILPDETPALTLDGGYALLNGQLINDAESTLFDGKRVPNAIGADVTLILSFTADGAGAYATVDEADRMAIGIHDDITGTGIADDTVVKSMDYSTGFLRISDTAAVGSKSVTFTNEGRSPKGGIVAGTVGNQMQRITGSLLDTLNGTVTLLGDSPSTLTGAFTKGGLVSGASRFTMSSTSDPGRSFDFDSADSPNARTTATTNGRTTGDCFNVALYMKIK